MTLFVAHVAATLVPLSGLASAVSAPFGKSRITASLMTCCVVSAGIVMIIAANVPR